MPLNKSEAFVHDLCTKSFLSLWSHANLDRTRGKELCDILVVCDPDVVVISVKDVAPTESGDTLVDWKRWFRKAVDASAKQAYGAARWLESRDSLTDADGIEIRCPSREARRTHLVAVACGSQGKTPLAFGDFGKGFVHVFDEQSFAIVMQELDTISDFTKYLRDKEAWVEKTQVMLNGGEEDLLAVYLNRGHNFPRESDRIMIEPDCWDEFSRKPEYRRKQEADRESRWWDGIIETFCEDFSNGGLMHGNTRSELEGVVRVMAREDRFARRMLGQSWKEFMDKAAADEVAARAVESPSGVVYVFLATPRDRPREVRRQELALRCFVARGLHRGMGTVVGLVTERYQDRLGFSFDALRLHIPEWTEEHAAKCRGIQDELGYFRNPALSQTSVNEYPQT